MTFKTTKEQFSAEIHSEILSDALEKAKAGNGVFLNATGKSAAKFYPKETVVSPFNSLMLSLYSDRNHYKTNLYTLFSDARKRGESVQSGEKGVPFIWYSWKGYENKSNPGDKISREDYQQLPPAEQAGYKAIRDREVRTLFNIEQTTLPYVNPKEFESLLEKYGSKNQENVGEQADKQQRNNFNNFLKAINTNLVPIRKDGTGIARYDVAKDVISLPAQKHFPSYAEYVQETLRLIISATGHPQRIGRQGVSTHSNEMQQQRERLVTELASAVKMAEMGMPARLSSDSMQYVDAWEKELSENKCFIIGLEADINNALSMVAKAERGEKVELSPVIELPEPQTDAINAKVVMLQDDANRWALYIKPENEPGFSIYPEKSDIHRFFITAKQGNDMLTEKVRQELAQKYYTMAAAHPDQKVDLFKTAANDIDLSLIEKVNLFRTNSENARILCLPTLKDIGKVKPREVSSAQWQRMWIAEDKQEYKKNLAATLFADVLRELKEKQATEQKPEEKKEERLELAPIVKQYCDLKRKHPDALLLFRAGDFYETYQEDARTASNILGITLTRSSKLKDNEGKPLEMAGFPFHALDTYLPKLVRAGQRVAICEQMEATKQQPAKEEVKQNTEQHGENHRRGMHR